MKNFISAALLLMLAAPVLIFASAAYADTGSEDDVSIPADTPVTYGYLQKFRDELKREIIDEISSEGGINIQNGYADISVSKGEFIIPGAGCELIYRGGGAAAVTSSLRAGDGIGDMSMGPELFSGEKLVFGHIYYASDSEAEKAIIITGETAYFTVHGNYEIR